ncbi:O2 contryphan Vc1-like [Gigantopelta aegis]|uniref:O2 contryphan Vc1-like n=1 Tax=Gigantopelta aegis TaxID=1735272 RepID=UPI001B8895FD|nr:O2 contryphan Vc1-like [Gigantopelta aegis]
MAQLSKIVFAMVICLLFLTVNLYVEADEVRSRRDAGDLSDGEMVLTPDDIAVLQKLLAIPSPSKRRLCKSGYTFNPVVGRCQFSKGWARRYKKSKMY